LSPSLTQAVFNAACLLLLLRLVEPRWGGAETLRFALLANAGAGVATFFILFLVYVVTRNDYLLYAQVAGGQALVAALLVAVKQLLPEQELVLGGGPRLRGKHAASAFLVVFACVCVVRGDAPTALHAAAGAAAGWVYLRHFQARCCAAAAAATRAAARSVHARASVHLSEGRRCVPQALTAPFFCAGAGCWRAAGRPVAALRGGDVPAARAAAGGAFACRIAKHASRRFLCAAYRALRE
jgi:drug/metabolite transporter (DMT)-like permease